MDLKLVCCLVLYLILAGGAVWLFVHSSALRADVVVRKPYSFSRVQLWFWKVIVLGSFITGYLVTTTELPVS